MSNFENFENLEVNGEIHADPFNDNQLGKIYLYVDWEKRQASIENLDGNATPFAVCNKRHDMIQLSSVVDTEYFKHSVYPRIIPLLQKMSEKYETVWNGSDMVGKFNMDQEIQTKMKEDIIEICQDASEVDGMVLFDVYDTCSNYEKDIPEIFEDHGYNFREVDIDSMHIDEIKGILAGDSLWIGDSDEEIKEDLKDIQKELKALMEDLQ